MPTLAQKWIEQGIDQGMEKGVLKGKAEGRAEGELRGQAKLLHNQIKRRFGSVPGAVEQRLSSASAEELNRFAVNIFDAKTAEEVVELGK